MRRAFAAVGAYKQRQPRRRAAAALRGARRDRAWVLRDVLRNLWRACARRAHHAAAARILYSHSELYAVPALFGGLATTTLVRLAPSMAMEAVLLGAWCTVVGRILAVSHGLRLPVFPAAASSKSLLHVTKALVLPTPPASSKLAEPCFPPSADGAGELFTRSPLMEMNVPISADGDDGYRASVLGVTGGLPWSSVPEIYSSQDSAAGGLHAKPPAPPRTRKTSNQGHP